MKMEEFYIISRYKNVTWVPSAEIKCYNILKMTHFAKN